MNMSDVSGDRLNAAPRRVLVVDDDTDVCTLLQARLTARGFDVHWMTSPAAALEHLENADVHVVITDVKMAELDGLELCERVAHRRPDVPVIVMTAFGTIETAIAAIRRGAYDFITKPIAIDPLVVALDRAIEHRGLRAEVKRLQQVLEEYGRFGELVGTSVPMRRLYDLLDRVAGSDATVLVTGETGTGKELVARELHRRSARAGGRFVGFNCSAIPAALLESELFGHTVGAFTDARRARAGLCVEASGGTLFLDEVGDLPRPLQTKLLRLLQERTVRPVGGDREIAVDLRVISATNEDPETAVRDGRLRQDLYFRLNVIRVEVPPLRARGTDVLVLAQCFVRQFATRAGKSLSGFSETAARCLLAYDWPGNVRELQNCIEHAVALTETDRIDVPDLPDRLCEVPRHAVSGSTNDARLATLEEVERRHILHVLEAVAGHRNTAARILGLDRKTLYRKLARYRTKNGDSAA